MRRGGVNGWAIEYRFYDDAYNPAQTVQLTCRVVEQDKVFAVFSSMRILVPAEHS